MREFFTAAKEDLGEVDPSNQLTFLHDETEVTFNKPSTGQMALMLSMGNRKMTMDQMGTFIALFIELGDGPTQRYLQSRLLDASDSFDIESEGGIMDMFEALVEDWSARPTKQPSDFQKSRRRTGPASTAPTRAKASTSSRSRSTASST